MAPYDSDSDDDDDEGTQLSYSETDVLLGYAQKEAGGETVSRLGGHPSWLVPDEAPSAALARCRVCQALMVLLLQLNGELPERFAGHERRLYVFACRNKACRRKPGSIRAVRGVRLLEAREGAEAAPAREPEKAPEKPAGTAPGLGESLFGVAKPFGSAGSSNPFAIGAAAASSQANPFSKTVTAPAPPADAATSLPKTFAETLSLNADDQTSSAGSPAAIHGPPPPPEPWPPVAGQPAAYPVSWIAEAEYETLDPAPEPRVPTGATMELDDGPTGGGGAGKEDKYVFESNMDAAFQKFADRASQNPEQVIRYEFGGVPLLYSRDDGVGAVWPHQPQPETKGVTTTTAGLPACPSCRARRVFEVQLMPRAIDLLEADELGLEGMDWGTVLVAVCEKDCQARHVRPGAASYLEEWVGVQWEELQAKR